jgi:mannitol/fructose-specific phosphotransferase system IIA component (Ntr-type)
LETRNKKEEVKSILSKLKTEYGHDPFIDYEGKKLVDPMFLFFVVDSYLTMHKKTLTDIKDILTDEDAVKKAKNIFKGKEVSENIGDIL